MVPDHATLFGFGVDRTSLEKEDEVFWAHLDLSMPFITIDARPLQNTN
jgi:hypothetical protein